MTLHRNRKSNANFEISRRSLLLAGSATAAAILRPLIAKGQAAATATGGQAKRHQAKAPKTQPFGADAFKASQNTTIRWLGAAGFFINSRGTTVMVDPLMEGFDMPVMIDMPIMPKDVVRLDAVLITHSDTRDWQNAFPRPGQRHFAKEDCCGFWIETPDGTIWATGDSRLIPQHLQLQPMDAILLVTPKTLNLISG